TDGWCDLKELFDGQYVAPGIDHRRQVVHSRGQSRTLFVLLGLKSLLDTGVEVTNVGLNRDDPLALKLDPQPEDPVGAGVLRPHVQHEATALITFVPRGNERLVEKPLLKLPFATLLLLYDLARCVPAENPLGDALNNSHNASILHSPVTQRSFSPKKQSP